MIAYVDTSALIKKYVKEQGSDQVRHSWNSAVMIGVSMVAFAEFCAALNRKLREHALSQTEYMTTLNAFKADWNALVDCTFERLYRESDNAISITRL